MTNVVQPSARNLFLTGALSWLSGNYRVCLVDAGYVYDAGHENLDDVDAGDRLGTSGNLTGLTATGGVADADDVTVTVAAGETIAGIWLYKHTGTESTSTLVAWIDTDAGGAALALLTNGEPVQILWSNLANGVFAI